VNYLIFAPEWRRTLRYSGGELLTPILDINSVSEMMRRMFGVVHIPCVCGEPGLATSCETYPFLFLCLVGKRCVSERVVMWSIILSEVMQCSGGGYVVKGRESVPVMDCEIFTLRGAGTEIKKRR
jgi:hypothetical protein